MSSPAKTRNCVFGTPDCDHWEMRGIAFDPTQRVGSLVAKDRAAIGDGDSTHKMEILIALCRRRTTMPDAGIVDCRSDPGSKSVAEGQILIFRWHIVARAEFWGWVCGAMAATILRLTRETRQRSRGYGVMPLFLSHLIVRIGVLVSLSGHHAQVFSASFTCRLG
jgi:hypothetical protein